MLRFILWFILNVSKTEMDVFICKDFLKAALESMLFSTWLSRKYRCWGVSACFSIFLFLPKFRMYPKFSGYQICWWVMKPAGFKMAFNEGILNQTSAPRNVWLHFPQMETAQPTPNARIHWLGSRMIRSLNFFSRFCFLTSPWDILLFITSSRGYEEKEKEGATLINLYLGRIIIIKLRRLRNVREEKCWL